MELPKVPLNRVLREGELPCIKCGSGKCDHAERDHAYTRRKVMRRDRCIRELTDGG